MERTLTSLSPHTAYPDAASLPGSVGVDALPRPADSEPARLALLWARLRPLWRHLVWLLALFATLVAAVVVRLDVQSLRKDLDRTARATAEAQVVNDRLRLEVDARRRSAAMEAVATQLELGHSATVVDLRGASR